MKKVQFTLSKQVTTRDILMRTCYNFIDNYYIFIDIAQNDAWDITLMPKDNSNTVHGDIEGEFRNTVINESFREQLIEKTKTVKELIVARALFGADRPADSQAPADDLEQEDFSFLDKEIDDYLDDPLGIAIPWEEKNKEKKDIPAKS